MVFSYDPLLVALSVLIAAQGGYVGFRLTAQVTGDGDSRDRLLLMGAAASLATGIWAMHFIGMLALRFAVPPRFTALPTLLSLLICALVVGPATYAIHAPLQRPARVLVGGLLMGLGIAAMHYVGMAGLDSGVIMANRPGFVAASLLIGIAGSSFAIWVMQQGHNRAPLWAAAGIFAFSVAGMHYVAVAGMTMNPLAAMTPPPPAALSAGALALLVALAAFAISAAFLLSLLPRHGVLAPEVPKAPAVPGMDAIQVDQNGRRIVLALQDVHVIRANAHYTYISDAQHEYFCPLPISQLEAALNQKKFVRVHRSFIVNVEHVVGLRRAGDSARLDMRCMVHRKIPVARARIAPVKSRLADRDSGETAPSASVLLT
ncbi:MAG: LytTR family transcriptional regulator DNA-binding domain-containing protein [Hyphomicrobiales bacterium]|nr:LytTR family transcriptional regulator DNA-binding domain-containing protein [Hyphomicrobiales bacterium]